MNNKIYSADNQIDKFLGVQLPLSSGIYGHFNPSIYTSDQIKSNIQYLLMTKRGERIMWPTFGSNLDSFLFENLDPGSVVDIIKEETKRLIHEWLPYVSLGEINAKVKDNVIYLKISFTLDEEIYEELIFKIIGGK